nr:ribonuclease H-like domain-containing protein [Tanacetum cinerariifolium]
MPFLTGLDDSYMQIRSSILFREVLPDVRSTYATISIEESHRVAYGSNVGSSQRNQASAFVSNVPNRNNFQRNNPNINSGPRPNNLNNNKQGGSSALVCKNYGYNGHTIERYFKIIGYRVDFSKKKSGQSFKEKTFLITILLGLVHLLGLQMNKWLFSSLSSKTIKFERMCKPIWQVGHPNGTKAFIYKIRNFKLSNGLILYDVLVTPEYRVTLISVHKLARENKIIVAFDENRCYFLNHDLNLRNILGTGNQCEGLYYYNNQEPVLNV